MFQDCLVWGGSLPYFLNQELINFFVIGSAGYPLPNGRFNLFSSSCAIICISSSLFVFARIDAALATGYISSALCFEIIFVLKVSPDKISFAKRYSLTSAEST